MLGFLGKEGNKASGEAVDTVAIIAVRSRGESTMVTVRFEGRIWRELTGFADEKGYVKREDLLSLLFAYGMSDREGVDMKKRHSEMAAIGGRYASMKFRAYELFADNCAMTIALAATLSENIKLRAEAQEKGLRQEKEEAWDSWGQEEIDGLYRRYVFAK